VKGGKGKGKVTRLTAGLKLARGSKTQEKRIDKRQKISKKETVQKRVRVQRREKRGGEQSHRLKQTEDCAPGDGGLESYRPWKDV